MSGRTGRCALARPDDILAMAALQMAISAEARPGEEPSSLISSHTIGSLEGSRLDSARDLATEFGCFELFTGSPDMLPHFAFFRGD